MYADIMASVNVVITEVPVSKPKLRPLSSQVDRPTCWGQPVTVRCGCEQGTGVRYTWYKSTQLEDTLLHDSADIHLQCGTLDKDSDYYCTAHNDISSDRSDILSVQVLMPAESSCIYVINMEGQPIYDCVDRMSTTLASTSPPLTTCQATLKIHSDTINQSSQINQTDQHLFLSRSWTGLPLWYTLLRWVCFASLLIFLCIIIKCTKARPKRVKRRGRVRSKHHPHLVR
ncbi:uncharacterized protein LOC109141871 isoform X2 [Larimichthys crocea]|nr:uncharacterized protein LOC109141871 isoform X2 [Larimichthys crocea]XP_027144128.1 uncharacterized protein LOC109141871 isoform X2 [Larimichthys crocea]